MRFRENNEETTFYRIYDKWDGDWNIYEEVLKDIKSIYKTWITKVIWKHWKINKVLNKLVWDWWLDNINEWSKFEDIEKSEKSLSRYILSHIHHKLSWDYNNFHPEEIYLKNIWDNKYATWTVLEKEGTFYIILTPACDIAQDKLNYYKLYRINSYPKSNTQSKSCKKS